MEPWDEEKKFNNLRVPDVLRHGKGAAAANVLRGWRRRGGGGGMGRSEDRVDETHEMEDKRLAPS